LRFILTKRAQTVWIGCSDSRVPETTLLGLQPGDVFVHRNIANVVSPTDISVSAVVEYAVVHLKVSHIVLCGHTCCGGAAAALSNARVGGVLDTWLTPLKAVRKIHQKEIDAVKEDGDKAKKLAELNVQMGVGTLMANYVVEEAVRERGLQVHGVIYDIGCGKIRDLGFGTGEGAKSKSATSTEKEQPLEIVKGNHGVLVFTDGAAAMTVR
jgi:carbonic anhydrase